jgi:hypothetical protein
MFRKKMTWCARSLLEMGGTGREEQTETMLPFIWKFLSSLCNKTGRPEQ